MNEPEIPAAVKGEEVRKLESLLNILKGTCWKFIFLTVSVLVMSSKIMKSFNTGGVTLLLARAAAPIKLVLFPL